ncbi:MAG: adenylate/guanylate cyclase domain-containing protein [Alphaproteobacteria bacterium]|nr:adenylate/guanylate cyclase domain-containing protein [Alphaproteobacteria bacterium]
MIRGRALVVFLGLALVLGLGAVRIADPFPVTALREIGFDILQRAAPRPAGDFPITVIDIDEPSLAELGQWPWPRNLLATMTERLAELGAAVVVFDILFAEPDRLSPARIADLPGLGEQLAANAISLPDNDAIFAKALSGVPSVIGFAVSADGPPLSAPPKSGVAISGTDPTSALSAISGAILPLPGLREAATGLGSISLDAFQSVGVVRQIPLIWTAGEKIYPTLALEALRVAQGDQTLIVNGEVNGGAYAESVRVGAFEVPTTPSGGMWLRFRPLPDELYVPAKDVLASDYTRLQDRIAGNIVLVGTSAAGLLDIRATPLGNNVPGVSIHVQVLEQILSATFLHRADWVTAIELLGFALIGIVLILAIPALPPLGSLLVGVLSVAAIGGVSFYAFVALNLLLDWTFVLVAAALVYLALILVQLFVADARKRQLRRAFGQYVSPQLLRQIEQSGAKLTLGGEVRDLTIMFADIRGFTELSERLGPADLVRLLNGLFGTLGSAITSASGTIDKFIGDAIMAFWNAPVDVADHAAMACRAALEMRVRLDGFNDQRGGPGGATPPIAIGMGLATGEALVGNLGLESRFDYSCVGDTVNVAARIEAISRTVGYDIVVAAKVRDEAPDFAFLPAGSLTLKGKSDPVQLFILVGDHGVAGTGWFVKFAEQFDVAIAALSKGEGVGEGGPAQKALQTSLNDCRAIAGKNQPRLTGFIDRIEGRQDDFIF